MFLSIIISTDEIFRFEPASYDFKELEEIMEEFFEKSLDYSVELRNSFNHIKSLFGYKTIIKTDSAKINQIRSSLEELKIAERSFSITEINVLNSLFLIYKINLTNSDFYILQNSWKKNVWATDCKPARGLSWPAWVIALEKKNTEKKRRKRNKRS